MAEATAPAFDEMQLKSDVLAFLDETRFAMLVTNGQDGFPMARMMGFLHDGFTIWLTTVNDSFKIRQMRRDNKVTLLWKEPTERFFKFITLKGTIEIFEDAETVNAVRERYGQKYGMRGGGEAGDLPRVAMKITPLYLRAEGFGIAPPPVIQSF